MRVSSLLLLLCTALVAVYCISENTLHEQWISQPLGWKQSERPDANTPLLLHIAVKQQNLDVLHDTLFDVSDPTSPNYGKHLTAKQVNDMVAPTQESVKAVFRWLNEAGIDSSRVRPNGNFDMLEAKVTVAEAESLLDTEYFYFDHFKGSRVLRTSSYSLPKEVSKHVDFVGPTIRFPNVHKRLIHSRNPVPVPVNPSFLRQLYGVGNATNTAPNNQQAVASFLNQYYNPDDLQTFFKKFSPSSEGQKANLVGPNIPLDPGLEASLDIEYIMSVGTDINSTFWSTAGRQPDNHENEPFLVFLYNLGNATDPPLVVSMSYGDNENTVNYDYAVRVNVEFQKAGARGISMMSSSGDGGVGGSQPTLCKVFIPNFPAASPYVTAVGGTTSSNPEVAASLSSGGFSNYWSQPSYQASAVNTYLTTAPNLPSSDKYNASGAGFPDVSAQAVNFDIVVSGNVEQVSGTSCSSPTFTGIIALLNSLRLSAGKGPLGYLNPLFYQNPNIFTDIVSGNNPGCESPGFYATKGWDPVTGLGTPNYPAMAQLVTSLP
jgi:tripeptidyl-peptidase-1